MVRSARHEARAGDGVMQPGNRLRLGRVRSDVMQLGAPSFLPQHHVESAQSGQGAAIRGVPNRPLDVFLGGDCPEPESAAASSIGRDPPCRSPAHACVSPGVVQYSASRVPTGTLTPDFLSRKWSA